MSRFLPSLPTWSHIIFLKSHLRLLKACPNTNSSLTSTSPVTQLMVVWLFPPPGTNQEQAKCHICYLPCSFSILVVNTKSLNYKKMMKANRYHHQINVAHTLLAVSYLFWSWFLNVFIGRTIFIFLLALLIKTHSDIENGLLSWTAIIHEAGFNFLSSTWSIMLSADALTHPALLRHCIMPSSPQSCFPDLTQCSSSSMAVSYFGGKKMSLTVKVRFFICHAVLSSLLFLNWYDHIIFPPPFLSLSPLVFALSNLWTHFSLIDIAWICLHIYS